MCYVICPSKNYCSLSHQLFPVCVIRSVWVRVWARRRKSWPTQVWIWLLSWRVWRGREGFGLMEGLGGKRRRTFRSGGGGRDPRRKGKCGSTQSKPCHMFQSAGISPLVQTRMLCKRLLIRESACWKTECQLGLKHLTALSAAMLSHGVTAWKADMQEPCWRC